MMPMMGSADVIVTVIVEAWSACVAWSFGSQERVPSYLPCWASAQGVQRT